MTLDVLAIGAHTDDVELGCGGTLISLKDSGYRTGIADLTDGLLATRGDEETRMREARIAAKIIGAEERFQLHFNEGSILSDPMNIYNLATLIRRTRPLMILAPYWEDRHPDHIDASRLIQTASFWSGVSKYGDKLPPYRPHRILFYHIHWEGPVSLVVDISSTFDLKLKAVRSYRSQFLPQAGSDKMTYISRPEFLEKLISRARYYGSLIGAEYGEPFFVREMNRVEDLMKWAGEQGVVG
ncbi:MAG: bacillithiol biosynthesis deacetylase BshB1 [Candidatus Hatepunaea meridiana]|nr:bacillithiol biosynthesis deacetylase BshB1 [Candidatus Hatepunaea meridiana]